MAWSFKTVLALALGAGLVRMVGCPSLPTSSDVQVSSTTLSNPAPDGGLCACQLHPGSG